MVVNPHANNPNAMKYGIGKYLDMLKAAINEHYDMQLVHDINEADVVHIHDPILFETVLPYLKMQKPVVVHYHTPIAYRSVRDIINAVHMVVFVSNALREKMCPDCEHVRIVHNAVNVQTKYFLPERFVDFAFMGRRKGKFKMKHADEFVSIALGDVQLKGFKNLGYADEKMIASVMTATKMHILPSKFEAFGMATLEAMAYGCIPVVSKNAGVNEVIPDNLKIVIDGDVDLRDVFSEYNERELYEKHEAAMRHAGEFNVHWYAERIYKVYKEAIR